MSSISYTNSATVISNSANQSTYTGDYDLGSSSDSAVLFVFVVSEADNAGGTSITSATYDGVAMTKGPSITHAFDLVRVERITLLYLINPSTGSNTLSVTTSGLQLGMWARGVTLTGVNESIVFNDSGSDSGVISNPTIDITPTADGSMILGMLARNSSTGYTLTSGTERWNVATFGVFADTNITMQGATRDVSAGATTLGWTAGGANDVMAVAFSIEPLFSVDVNDTIAITEDVSALGDVLITIVEVLSLVEDVINEVQLGDLSLVDTISLSDFTGGSIIFAQASVSDSVSITEDAEAGDLSIFIVPFEEVTLTESAIGDLFKLGSAGIPAFRAQGTHGKNTGLSLGGDL